MTRENALEWLLNQALCSLNGFKPKNGIFIKARRCDFMPFELWNWKEECRKSYTGEPWLPNGIKYDFVDCSEQIGNRSWSFTEVIEIAVRELTGENEP